MTSTHQLDVPGARLRYWVRGTGPVLVVTGAPMDAASFAPLADALSDSFTVITHDPRGVAGSTVQDENQDSTPELRADDIAAILDAVGAESADVFGSSGGAVTGLALAQRHPHRVRTLVAHEPPLLELLPDAARRRAEVEDIIDTFNEQGPFPAWRKFMISAGFEIDDAAGPQSGGSPDQQSSGQQSSGQPSEEHGPPEQDPEQALADSRHFFCHELRGTTRYLPDVQALTAGPARVVVGLGVQSGALSTDATSKALAALLGSEPIYFPGDHGGFMAHPAEFAAALASVLTVETVLR